MVTEERPDTRSPCSAALAGLSIGGARLNRCEVVEVKRTRKDMLWNRIKNRLVRVRATFWSNPEA